MKSWKPILLYIFILHHSYSQITVSKFEGGSVVTKLGMGINVNGSSTLKREWIVINNPKCPMKLSDAVGINVNYTGSGYKFVPVGNIVMAEPIVAYEIHHVLYNVFGQHIKTLSNLEIADLNETKGFDKYSSWYASENQVSEYLFCVSYVAYVRMKSGVIWRYNPDEIKQELSKIQIAYEEGYSPSKEKEK